MEQLKIEYLPVGDLKPYEQNARQHGEPDVEAIAASIREFGFDDPIGIWGDENLIVEGHGRLLAAERLKIKQVPVIRLDHLTDEQRRAYALAHNKTAELSGWNFATLDSELAQIAEIDMSAFGFNEDAIQKGAMDWFRDRERFDREQEEGNEEYNEFLDKFEIKKTTDDCYTPDTIYDCVAEYVANTFGVDRKAFIRPFYPGGDYESENYEGKIVVDNPPFSILAQIVDFYVDRKIPFFLFAPGVSSIGYTNREGVLCICAFADVTYENGAQIKTNFLTNLQKDGIVAESEPWLHEEIEKINTQNEKALHRQLPKYSYPVHVVTAAMLGYLSEHGEELKIHRDDSVLIWQLDAQKELDKEKTIFGAGLLLSEKAAAEKAAAEKFELSEREWAIVRSLGGNYEQEQVEG